jgi:signal transduction histidine kinase
MPSITPLPSVPENSEAQSHKNASFHGSNASILIVDDSPDNLRVLSATLAESNYDIRCAKNGTMALKAIAATDLPDLILLDIQMPDLSGYEVCQQLKADMRTRHIPIIFISALDDALDKVKAFSVGGVDYITKPFQVEEVIARVRNQLNLQAAKVQLAQSEKMASLGQLVAGIAHEINNPVGFIQGNLDCLKESVKDLLRLLETYQQAYPEPSEKIQAVSQEIDFTYLQEDLPSLLKSMTMGTERIAAIVHSLRNFSRLENSSYQLVDIHEGIDDTLLILESRLKAVGALSKIEIVKAYGDLSPVKCYPGLLNQVLMNLLANAIDAVHEQCVQASTQAGDPYIPQIAITTAQAESAVTIRIRDNGAGIPEALKARLFTPFFTTKPVGKGTGLGLAISQQIIHDDHQGQLVCQSQPGLGTEFIITLPKL